jgi:hypothetical protein
MTSEDTDEAQESTNLIIFDNGLLPGYAYDLRLRPFGQFSATADTPSSNPPVRCHH